MEPDQDVFETWPLLTAVGLAFLGVFLVVVGLGALPVRLLDPVWQLAVAASITNSGGYLLNGLALLFLASALAPDSTALLGSLLQARRWAAVASLCFLLVVPLQAFSLWRLDRSSAEAAAEDRQAMESRISALRNAVTRSRTTADLQAGLQALGAPPLSPMEMDLPPAELRRRVLETFDLAEGDVRRRSEQARNRARDPVLQRRTAQSILLSLLFGVALAAGSRLPGSRLSLQQQLRAVLTLPLRLVQLLGVVVISLIEAALDWREARAEARLHDGTSSGTNDPETDQSPQPPGSFPSRSKRNGFLEEDYIQLIQEVDKPSS